MEEVFFLVLGVEVATIFGSVVLWYVGRCEAQAAYAALMLARMKG